MVYEYILLGYRHGTYTLHPASQDRPQLAGRSHQSRRARIPIEGKAERRLQALRDALWKTAGTKEEVSGYWDSPKTAFRICSAREADKSCTCSSAPSISTDAAVEGACLRVEENMEAS
ncbi:hypothetical protein K523DRAFT_320138 [Schizophyllum commune Tattone D]|nr:hypothetical protein K523DRAFT_320138 [Schizophyllum commune Tattone D]